MSYTKLETCMPEQIHRIRIIKTYVLPWDKKTFIPTKASNYYYYYCLSNYYYYCDLSNCYYYYYLSSYY